jgi:hypothetical protein
MVRRFCTRNSRFSSSRLLRQVHEVLTNASFPAACRAAGIPRGSQGRYRNALKACFKDLPSHGHSSPSRIRDLGPGMLRTAKRGGKNEARDR